jgi:hypothetical protein
MTIPETGSDKGSETGVNHRTGTDALVLGAITWRGEEEEQHPDSAYGDQRLASHPPLVVARNGVLQEEEVHEECEAEEADPPRNTKLHWAGSRGDQRRNDREGSAARRRRRRRTASDGTHLSDLSLELGHLLLQAGIGARGGARGGWGLRVSPRVIIRRGRRAEWRGDILI